MELYASAALNGIGYALNKERDTLKKTEKVNNAPMPSMQNIYKSNFYNETRSQEFDLANKKWTGSQNPYETGIVPKPAYASMFANPSETIMPEGANSRRFRTLAGVDVPPEQFIHNNMQHFITGSVKQNTSDNAYSNKLESHTGRGNLFQKKKEVECLFEPTAGYGNPCGFSKIPTQYELAHIQLPKARNNDFPISPMHVGKGLGKGFTAEPSGGFQQSNTLDYIRPKNVDQLRVATRPRVTYELPPQGPGKGITRRGIEGEVAKNKPDKYYEQSSDMWLQTTGAFKKETGRPEQSMKATARVDSHLDYQGISQLGGTNPGMGTNDDYGVNTITVYDNNRQDTGAHTVLNNLTTTVKSIISPLLDLFRHTPKEYTLDSARPYGNMQAQIPEKPTTYDPVNHMMKTTIKETTIHDTIVSNLKGAERGTAANMDETRKTVRETVDCQDTTRNISAHKYKVSVYNVDQVARTTIRQTTKQTESMYGYIGGNVTESTGAYSVIDVDMKNTQRQFQADYEYEGIADGGQTDFRETSKEADYNAEIDATRDALNVAAAHTPNGAGGFTGVSGDMIDMESKKLVKDSLAERDIGNITRVAQNTPHKDACEITKVGNNYLNANNNRLDPNLLNSLKSNPYNLSINPIG